MLAILHTVIQNRFFQGALTGLVGAAAVDYHAFQTWKSFSDVKTYQWSTALFRWVQGVVGGLVVSAGIWGVS